MADKRALILIDVQQGFEDPELGPRDNPQAEANIAALIAAWRDRGDPVVVVQACLAGLRERGFRLCAAVPGATTRLEDLDPQVPTAFLLGNEHAGLSPAARAACDVEFAIPLFGFSESLNLSVATAITVYTHCTRRRTALGRSGDLDAAALLALRARFYARDVRGGPAIIEHYRRRLATSPQPPQSAP